MKMAIACVALDSTIHQIMTSGGPVTVLCGTCGFRGSVNFDCGLSGRRLLCMWKR
jgi:hypothetical protein